MIRVFAILICLLGTASFSTLAFATETQSQVPSQSVGNIVVTLTEYVPTHGTLVVSLTNQKDQFISATVPVFNQLQIVPTGSVSTVSFNDVPYGEYAVKAYQDRNASGKLDTLFGFPQEPTGYSNYESGMLPPPFKKCVFTHSGASTPINIVIRNFKK